MHSFQNGYSCLRTDADGFIQQGSRWGVIAGQSPLISADVGGIGIEIRRSDGLTDQASLDLCQIEPYPFGILIAVREHTVPGARPGVLRCLASPAGVFVKHQLIWKLGLGHHVAQDFAWRMNCKPSLASLLPHHLAQGCCSLFQLVEEDNFL